MTEAESYIHIQKIPVTKKYIFHKYRMHLTLCNFFYFLLYCSFLAELQSGLFYTIKGTSPMLPLKTPTAVHMVMQDYFRVKQATKIYPHSSMPEQLLCNDIMSICRTKGPKESGKHR